MQGRFASRAVLQAAVPGLGYPEAEKSPLSSAGDGTFANPVKPLLIRVPS